MLFLIKGKKIESEHFIHLKEKYLQPLIDRDSKIVKPNLLGMYELFSIIVAICCGDAAILWSLFYHLFTIYGKYI